MNVGAFIIILFCAQLVAPQWRMFATYSWNVLFGAVWNDIIFWLGVSLVLLDNVIGLAFQFCGARDFGKSIRSNFQTIWLVTVWSIWKEHNSIVFNRKEMSTKRLVYNIKINVWWWLKACKKGFYFDLNH
jgi:hypothetical protein